MRGEWFVPVGPPEAKIEIAEGLTLVCAADQRLELASLLLGREIRAKLLRTSQDWAVIDHLVNAALADLGLELAGIMGETERGDQEPYFALDLGLEEGPPLFMIAASRNRLRAFARSRTRTPPAGKPLHAPEAGVIDQTLLIGARLGGATLNFAEVQSLQAGDVIVLDQPASRRLDLIVDGKIAAEQALTVRTGACAYSLEIEREPDQW